jgi:hypothetical protein
MTSNNGTTSTEEISTALFSDATLHKRVSFLSGVEYISMNKHIMGTGIYIQHLLYLCVCSNRKIR